jgi:hypothetical protein
MGGKKLLSSPWLGLNIKNKKCFDGSMREARQRTDRRFGVRRVSRVCGRLAAFNCRFFYVFGKSYKSWIKTP